MTCHVPSSSAARVLWATSLLSTAALTACKSTDPTLDQHRAESIVAVRTDIPSPWSVRPSEALWDGQSELTSAAAVRLALLGNPEIRAALERIAESRADLVQSGLLPNPILNLSLGFPMPATDGSTSIGVSVVQQLAWLLQYEPRTDAAATDLDAEVLAASNLALSIASEVRSLHARAVFAQRAVRERQAAAEQAGRAIALARRAATAGEGTSLEVNRRDVRLIEQETDAARAAAEVAVLKRKLLERLARADASAEFALAETDLATLPASLTEQQVIDLAASQRLDTAAAHARAEAARIRAGLARSDIWADTEAGIGYTRDDQGRNELGPELGIPIPIFDTGAARTAKAAAAARQSALEAAAVRAAAISEARAAWIEASSAQSVLAGRASELVAVADRTLELSRRGFAAGTLDLTTLLESEENAIQARIRLIEIQQTAALSVIDLTRAVGGRLEALPEPQSAATPK